MKHESKIKAAGILGQMEEVLKGGPGSGPRPGGGLSGSLNSEGMAHRSQAAVQVSVQALNRTSKIIAGTAKPFRTVVENLNNIQTLSQQFSKSPNRNLAKTLAILHQSSADAHRELKSQIIKDGSSARHQEASEYNGNAAKEHAANASTYSRYLD